MFSFFHLEGLHPLGYFFPEFLKTRNFLTEIRRYQRTSNGGNMLSFIFLTEME